jgi:hypothetical protein
VLSLSPPCPQLCHLPARTAVHRCVVRKPDARTGTEALPSCDTRFRTHKQAGGANKRAWVRVRVSGRARTGHVRLSSATHTGSGRVLAGDVLEALRVRAGSEAFTGDSCGVVTLSGCHLTCVAAYCPSPCPSPLVHNACTPPAPRQPQFNERMGLTTLQTHQDPIMLLRWLHFFLPASSYARGSAHRRLRERGGGGVLRRLFIIIIIIIIIIGRRVFALGQ